MPAAPSYRVLSPNLAPVVTQWSPGIKPTWKLSEVRAALRLHRQGDFSLSAQLVDTMGEDDAIPGLLEKRVDAVLKEEFSLSPVEKPNRALSKRMAADLQPKWWDMFPEAELDEVVRWYRMLGVGIAVLDWEKTATAWLPRLRTLHPQFLRRDETQGKWFYQAREGQFEVTPGDGFWILLTDGQRGWMRGLVRAAAIPWIGKQLTIRDQGRYNERHGLPILLARVPAVADEDDKDAFWEDLQGIATETMVELPSDLNDQGARYDLELLETKDQAFKTFEVTLDRWDRRLTILFLGANLSTEIDDQGTQSASQNHGGELTDKACADEKRLSTQIRQQGVYPICVWNYAGAQSIETTPWPHWDTEPPEDTKAETEDQEAFGNAIKAVEDAGYDVENVVELGEKHGLKLKKREPAKPPPGGTPPAPPPGTPPQPEERRRLRPALASGASARENRGFLEGQLYVDALVEHATAHAEKALQSTLDVILEELDAATDMDDLRARLHARYEDMSPEDISDLIYRASIVAELAGRHAVSQDA